MKTDLKYKYMRGLHRKQCTDGSYYTQATNGRTLAYAKTIIQLTISDEAIRSQHQAKHIFHGIGPVLQGHLGEIEQEKGLSQNPPQNGVQCSILGAILVSLLQNLEKQNVDLDALAKQHSEFPYPQVLCSFEDLFALVPKNLEPELLAVIPRRMKKVDGGSYESLSELLPMVRNQLVDGLVAGKDGLLKIRKRNKKDVVELTIKGLKLAVRLLNNKKKASVGELYSHTSSVTHLRKVRLLVECREGGGDNHHLAHFCDGFKSNNITFTSKHLVNGDYQWQNTDTSEMLPIIVERKSYVDLADSIIDGRFERQKQRMLSTAGHALIYLLEGDLNRTAMSFKCGCGLGCVSKHNDPPVTVNVIQAKVEGLINQGFTLIQTMGYRGSVSWLSAFTESLCIRLPASNVVGMSLVKQALYEAKTRSKQPCTAKIASHGEDTIASPESVYRAPKSNTVIRESVQKAANSSNVIELLEPDSPPVNVPKPPASQSSPIILISDDEDEIEVVSKSKVSPVSSKASKSRASPLSSKRDTSKVVSQSQESPGSSTSDVVVTLRDMGFSREQIRKARKAVKNDEINALLAYINADNAVVVLDSDDEDEDSLGFSAAQIKTSQKPRPKPDPPCETCGSDLCTLVDGKPFCFDCHVGRKSDSQEPELYSTPARSPPNSPHMSAKKTSKKSSPQKTTPPKTTPQKRKRTKPAVSASPKPKGPTVAQLKVQVAARGYKVTGTKAELIERLQLPKKPQLILDRLKNDLWVPRDRTCMFAMLCMMDRERRRGFDPVEKGVIMEYCENSGILKDGESMYSDNGVAGGLHQGWYDGWSNITRAKEGDVPLIIRVKKKRGEDEQIRLSASDSAQCGTKVAAAVHRYAHMRSFCKCDVTDFTA